jgi:hypothetical protein
MVFYKKRHVQMNPTTEKIVSEALELPPVLRAFVAERLLESLDADPDMALSPEWKEEIRKRCEEIDRGVVELRDAEAVFDKGYNAL